MPGTIQVSILGLVGLPSSLQSSSLSIKVSVGKQTYETMDKGDISFPLESLRDKLNVWIYDFDGNDVAHTAVEMRSIVEKGVWDDLFALDNGGYVCMKLRFILTEHELNRIRSMRESVSRKKKEDILRRSGSSSDLTVASGDPLKTVQTEDRGVTIANTQATGPSSASNAEVHSKASNQQKKQALPTSFSAGELDKLPIRRSVNKAAIPRYQESQSPSDKIPSNVKKMILAFESPVKEEAPGTSKSTEEPQISNRTAVEEHSNASTEEPQISNRTVVEEHSNASTEEPQINNRTAVEEHSNVSTEEPQISSRTAVEEHSNASAEEPQISNRTAVEEHSNASTEEPQISNRTAVEEHSNASTEEPQISNRTAVEEYSNASTEEPQISNRTVVEEHSNASRSKKEVTNNVKPVFFNLETEPANPSFAVGMNEESGKISNFLVKQNIDQMDPNKDEKQSRRSSSYERTKLRWATIARQFPGRMRVGKESVTELNWRSRQRKSSQHRVRYHQNHRNRRFLSSCRGWVFLDETIYSCIQSGSFQMTKDDDVQTNSEPVHPKILGSAKPPNDGPPKRPVGQVGKVTKVAIMVGFGLLVFFTRQRK